MAILSTAVWRVRIGGNTNNGGGYDASIGAPGTDYSQQDAAQLALTDLACTTGTSTLTSATGGFTSAMVSNGVHIRSGTNFTVAYYFITAFTDTNTVTLDRDPTTGSNASGGSGNVGGAFALLSQIWAIGSATNLKAIAGNHIWIRGSGSDNPTSADYVESTYISGVHGTQSNRITLQGENGRPMIGNNTRGLMYYNFDFCNLIDLAGFVHAGSDSAFGIFSPRKDSLLQRCLADTNNTNTDNFHPMSHGNAFVECEAWSGTNTPTLRAGRFGFDLGINYGNDVLGCYAHHLGGGGIENKAMGRIIDNVIYKCKEEGMVCNGNASSGFTTLVKNNTVDANEGHGIEITSTYGLARTVIVNNSISNQTGTGKAGLKIDTGTAAENDAKKKLIDYNNFYNNTSDRSAISAGDNDTALDPSFTDAANGDFRVGTNLKETGLPKDVMDGRPASARSHVDIGSFQREEPAGGGGSSSVLGGGVLSGGFV